MFEKFKSENLDSFRQRYEGTFGFYTDGKNKKRLLVKLTEITAGRCNFQDAKGVSYHVNPDHPEEVGFEFLPPKSQWYNTSKGAMFTQRLASRQFQRGVTGKTLEIHLLGKGQLWSTRVGFDTLSEIYEKALSPKDALPNLDREMSVAISGQFAFDNTGSVLLLREQIGDWKRDGRRFTIKLAEPSMWRTEITDALTAMGCTADIS
jgi:hypothetical protein